MPADESSAGVLPLAYQEVITDGALVRWLVRVLAGMGLLIGPLGVVSTTSLWMTSSNYFRPRLFTFGIDVDGTGTGIAFLMSANGLAWALAFIVLIPSSVAAWRLHPAGRRGLLGFAVLALAGSAVQVLARAVIAVGFVTLGRGVDPLNLAIWLTSGMLQIVVEAAYPIIILLVLRTGTAREAFTTGRRSSFASPSSEPRR